MKPLFIGIDPGTTSAVAGIDLEGETVFVESGRHLPQHELIQRILENGKPLVVASDKEKTPSTVEEVASSLGAILFEPNRDLSEERKKELGEGENSHERDASAAARHAARKKEKMRRKILEKAETENITAEKASRKYLGEETEDDDGGGEEPEETVEDPGEETIEARLRRRNKRLQEKIRKLEQEKQSLQNQETDKKEVKVERPETEEIRKREGIIKEKNDEIDRLNSKLEDTRKVVKAYRKALDKVWNGADLLKSTPSGFKTVDGEEYEHEELEGLELDRFFVADEKNRESAKKMFQEYREKRKR